MSQVQVNNVPTSSSPEELRQLFAQLGQVKSLLTSFEATKPEGTALVVYADAAAAEAAVELLDGYPLGTSLLEVQTCNRDNFVGRLVSSLLALQMSGGGGGSGGGPPAAGRGSGGTPVTNSGLWLGWIEMSVDKAQLAEALSPWGRVHVETLTAANELASNGRRYKWGIVHFERLEDAQAAKRDLDRQPLPGVSKGLKIMPYEPGRHGGRR
ncbi:RNP-1 like RNA-binding [Chlorella sorokiniana]|uniref:RNP-1 like RNA-binding n=1 Tax=Chlorella sorokiniana TaxID=3076 RepID=A0A2P6TPB5_CHLSO|nr:RNP-1 like RNA-binding [Chlorella sorokiniana]|eukprot:PRW51174.1 RNP-1 like RNA-binding [Chlorella sorokiniana]